MKATADDEGVQEILAEAEEYGYTFEGNYQLELFPDMFTSLPTEQRLVVER